MVLIFVIEIVAGVLGFVYSGEICRLIKTELKVGISSKYDQAQEQGLTEAWDTMQAQVCHYTRRQHKYMFYHFTRTQQKYGTRSPELLWSDVFLLIRQLQLLWHFILCISTL